MSGYSYADNFYEKNVKNAYKMFEAEKFKHKLFGYDLNEDLLYFERRHNDFFYSVAFVFFLLFSFLNCIGLNKNLGWSYLFSLNIFLNLGLLWFFIYIFFRRKDYIYKIGQFFLGNIFLLILLFLSFPFFEDIVLDRGIYFNVILTDMKIKFVFVLFMFLGYCYLINKIHKKFLFVYIIYMDIERKKKEQYYLHNQKQNEFWQNAKRLENPWNTVEFKNKEKELDYHNTSLPNLAIRMGYRPKQIKPIAYIECHEHKTEIYENNTEPEQQTIKTCFDEVKHNNSEQQIESEQIQSDCSDNVHKDLKNIDSKKVKRKRKDTVVFDLYNLFSSIMSPEEAAEVSSKVFFSCIEEQYSDRDFVGKNLILKCINGQLVKIKKTGEREPYALASFEQYLSRFRHNELV